MLHEALFSKKHNEKQKCFLCPHNCVIGNDKYGLCSVRTNQDGILKTTNYGEITAMAIDPNEKKPLYHFRPTKDILSVGSYGCNFTCGFCQNYSIAHHKPNSTYVAPEQLVEKCASINNNIGVAFTYNEPSIWYEYVYETSKLLKESYPDLNVVIVTNGYIEEEPLLKLLPYVDAMNIDLKSFTNDYYNKICGGNLKAVLKTIENSYKKCHVEITTLLVNDLNDSEEEVREIASYIGCLDKNIPLHLSRYFPTYKMDRPPTEIDVMLRDKKIAEEYLNYVYLGNLPNADRSTYCPKCGKLLIERNNFISRIHIDRQECPECGFGINIVI